MYALESLIVACITKWYFNFLPQAQKTTSASYAYMMELTSLHLSPQVIKSGAYDDATELAHQSRLTTQKPNCVRIEMLPDVTAYL